MVAIDDNQALRNKIARLIKYARIKNGYKQTEFAKLVGISQSAVSKIEQGLLDFSLASWVALNREFQLTTLDIERGLIDDQKKIPEEGTLSDELVKNFKLPSRYIYEPNTASRFILPFVDYIQSKTEGPKLINSLGVDPIYFTCLDNRLNINYLFDLSSELLDQSKPSMREELPIIKKKISNYSKRGRLAKLYDETKNKRSLVNTFIKNNAYYDVNFKYEIKDSFDDYMTIDLVLSDNVLNQKDRSEEVKDFVSYYNALYISSIVETYSGDNTIVEEVDKKSNQHKNTWSYKLLRA